MFTTEYKGSLYYLEDKEGSFNAIFRFDYNKNAMQNVKEGDFIACENFHTPPNLKSYSLLKVTSVVPKHYALEAIKGGGYPTFLKEVAKNIVEDWDSNESTETFINVEAIPMGYDLLIADNTIRDIPKRISKPIPGKNGNILSINGISQFLCRELNANRKTTIGHYRRNPALEIYVDKRKMIRRHFGVFGSTGTGKSNFLSQLIRTITQDSLGQQTQDRASGNSTNTYNLKVIIFDVQGEYSTLLADLLYNEGLVYLSESEITDNFRDFTNSNGNPETIENVARELAITSKKPERYENDAQYFYPFFRHLLETNRIRTINPSNAFFEIVDDLLDSIGYHIGVGNAQNPTTVMNLFRRLIQQRNISGRLTIDVVNNLLQIAQTLEENPVITSIAGQSRQHCTNAINRIISELNLVRDCLSQNQSEDAFNEIFESFITNNTNQRICIISISDEIDMRKAISSIVTRAISYRKRNPTFCHDVLFVFDEAHEYVPHTGSEESKQEEVDRSRNTLLRLARQGRKYGLGMCLATQRTRYLDTTIMGQLHTFFAGYLPRGKDRDVITDAFNIENKVLVELLELKPGEWLLCSAVATGLSNVPISITAENSEDALETFFRCPPPNEQQTSETNHE